MFEQVVQKVSRFIQHGILDDRIKVAMRFAIRFREADVDQI